MAEFARQIRRPFDAWQRWLAIHALELLADGRPRFRQLLVLVARQNGKTEFLVILSAFWLFLQRVGLVLGTSTKLDYAAESWKKLVELAKASPLLLPELLPASQKFGVRSTNGQETLTTAHNCRYKIGASNEEGGRSLTVDRLIEDELRQHHDWSAHEAAENAMNAVRDAQAWAISNMGDERSVVLNSLRTAALKFLETGAGDYRLGLFEWSAPEGVPVTDVRGLAQANPNLGHRIDLEALLGKAKRALEAGGEQEAKFRTEVLCQHVANLEPVKISGESWSGLADPDAPRPAGRPVLAVDIAPDRRSAAIGYAGLRADGRPQVGLIEHRSGTDWVVARLVELRARHDPIAVVLDPGSPAGTLVPDLAAANIVLTQMTARDMAAACGGLADAVASGRLVHKGDPILEMALAGAKSRDIGDGGWGWARKKSDADICPLVAVTEALWGLASVAEAPVRVWSLDDPDLDLDDDDETEMLDDGEESDGEDSDAEVRPRSWLDEHL